MDCLISKRRVQVHIIHESDQHDWFPTSQCIHWFHNQGQSFIRQRLGSACRFCPQKAWSEGREPRGVCPQLKKTAQEQPSPVGSDQASHDTQLVDHPRSPRCVCVCVCVCVMRVCVFCACERSLYTAAILCVTFKLWPIFLYKRLRITSKDHPCAL